MRRPGLPALLLLLVIIMLITQCCGKASLGGGRLSQDDDDDNDDGGDDDDNDDDNNDDGGDDDNDDDDNDDDRGTLTFYHHSVGECYLANGLADAAAKHGFELVAKRFAPETNCACDLRDWFAANPDQMKNSVLVKSCFPCSNIWSISEGDSVRQCYLDLIDQAKGKSARLLIIGPSPYAREEMEQQDLREVSQRGADLFDDLEDELGLLNANRELRDSSLPYLASGYQGAPFDSHPNDAGCKKVVQALDAWLP